jgi:hypothetical protein
VSSQRGRIGPLLRGQALGERQKETDDRKWHALRVRHLDPDDDVLADERSRRIEVRFDGDVPPSGVSPEHGGAGEPADRCSPKE